MLGLYVDHSQPYKTPQYFSGYNELVFDAKAWNGNMPNTIWAFFLMRGHTQR